MIPFVNRPLDPRLGAGVARVARDAGHAAGGVHTALRLKHDHGEGMSWEIPQRLHGTIGCICYVYGKYI